MTDQYRRDRGWMRTHARELAVVLAAFLVAIALGLSVRHGLVNPQAISPSHDIAAR